MLQFKKKADPVLVEELNVVNCPVCKAYVCHQFFMKDVKTGISSRWFSCSCGVVFQSKLPTGKKIKQEPFSKKFYDDFAYPVKVYSPIIEELIYGRKVLIVSPQNDYQQKEFQRRGWIVETVQDFEKHKFKESQKFNMVWLYSALEQFHDPIASLQFCHKLLVEDGILFIASPDTDFISTRSSSNFMHWDSERNHIMWNRRSICRHLEYLGFNIILNRQNYEHRFPVWDDFHILAQKKFF